MAENFLRKKLRKISKQNFRLKVTKFFFYDQVRKSLRNSKQLPQMIAEIFCKIFFETIIRNLIWRKNIFMKLFWRKKFRKNFLRKIFAKIFLFSFREKTVATIFSKKILIFTNFHENFLCNLYDWLFDGKASLFGSEVPL